MRTLLWFRGKELRLHDHAALHAAASSSEMIPLFVLAPRYFAPRGSHPAPNRQQFVLDSIRELARALESRGTRLCIVRGPASQVIPKLAVELEVDRVMAMRSCEPASRVRDDRIEAELRVPFLQFDHETLAIPGSVRTASGGPFQVYTPFARAAQAQIAEVTVLPTPRKLPPLPDDLNLPEEVPLPELEALGLERNPYVQEGGESHALERLKHFLRGAAAHYAADRDRMDLPGTSRLSADLRFGTLSVRRVWKDVSEQLEATHSQQRYRGELLWRDFSHHTLFERPELLREPFRRDFRGFPWLDDEPGYEAWWRGETGYPVVDAAARQLLREGFVHNRARMISASFLTKHLLVSYQRGEAHYLHYLTDGDLAQNNMGWQWSAGSGCDAQPYFRIFNPVTQGERFDPDGAYVRRYVPELSRLPTRYVHAPWTAPANVLRDAGVTLGMNYPQPIVEHTSARQRYLLVASEHLKGGARSPARGHPGSRNARRANGS